jgi:hypothetical protein
MMPTDESLMLAVRNGDVDQFAVLFERHHDRLFAFFYRMTGDPPASEDLAQEVFVRMLKLVFQQRITNDVTTGRGIHIEATPTIFLNGRQLQQIQPTVGYFATVIDEELKKAR